MNTKQEIQNYVDDLCKRLGIPCENLGEGAVSKAISGPPIVLKVTKLDNDWNKLFWANKKNFFHYLSSMSQATLVPKWLKYFVIPFLWTEKGQFAITIEPKLESYVTVSDFLENLTKNRMNVNSTDVNLDYVQKCIITAASEMFGEISGLIRHNDAHLSNVMISWKAPYEINNLHLRLIDYDWVQFVDKEQPSKFDIITLLKSNHDQTSVLHAFALNTSSKSDLENFTSHLNSRFSTFGGKSPQKTQKRSKVGNKLKL